MTNPLVSVCMITYNHEKYIAEAIEGVLMQEVDFEVELVVADDASTDRTSEVIQSYIDTHPRGSWIKYTRHLANKGMMGNFIWALKQCKGEYIGLCDGDDYWCITDKLSRQVNHLLANSSFSFSFHDATFQYQSGLTRTFSQKYVFLNRDNQLFSIKDLQAHKWFIPTCSLVFRRILIPHWISKSTIGDFSLQLALSEKGDFYFHRMIAGVYRVHGQGASNFVNTYVNRLSDIKLWFVNVKNINKLVLVRWYFAVLWRFLFFKLFKWKV